MIYICPTINLYKVSTIILYLHIYYNVIVRSYDEKKITQEQICLIFYLFIPSLINLRKFYYIYVLFISKKTLLDLRKTKY